MTTTSYQASSTLNPHPSNIPATYTATDPHHHAQTINYGSSPSAAPVTSTAPTSRFNKSFFLSIPGILKLVSLVSGERQRNSSTWCFFSLPQVLCFIALVCVETAWQCYGTHAFLAAVACLVIIIQVALIVLYAFRLNERLTSIDVEFLVSVQIESNRIERFVLIGWRVSSQTRRTVLGSTFVHKHVPNIISSSQ